MAAIDKIYGSQDDWYEFYNWLKNNKASYIKYLYPEEGYIEGHTRLSRRD